MSAQRQEPEIANPVEFAANDATHEVTNQPALRRAAGLRRWQQGGRMRFMLCKMR